MDFVHFRPGLRLLVLPILLVVVFATSATAQELFGAGLPGLPSVARALYGDGPYGFAISSDAKVGYGHIGLNFNLPAPNGNTLDLSFRDAHAWIGSLGVRADSRSGFSLALRGQGTASRNIGIQTSAERFDVAFWDGSKLQWWTLEGNLGYKVWPNCSALVGLRRDQLSVGLTNPRDETGQPRNFFVGDPGVFSESLQFFGDFSSRLWMPYVGLEFAGQQYRASLLWSPFARADIRVPDRAMFSLFFSPIISLALVAGADRQYHVQKPIQCFECNFEYNVNLGPNFTCQVWSSGSWMQLRGSGNMDALRHVFISIGGATLWDKTTPFGSGDTATFTRSLIAGGIGGVLSF